MDRITPDAPSPLHEYGSANSRPKSLDLYPVIILPVIYNQNFLSMVMLSATEMVILFRGPHSFGNAKKA